MSWQIERVVVGPIQCNCYIISDTNSGKAYLIDPGAESKDLLDFLNRRKFDLQAVLITHAHIDHIGGVQAVADEFGVFAHYHSGDMPLYENVRKQAQIFGLEPGQLEAKQPSSGSADLNDGQTFETEGMSLEVLHTPGHTPGSVCFLSMLSGGVVFTGDTLFEGSIGRTDLWGGSFEQIMASIRSRVMNLADNTVVLPGHGEKTTIGTERRHNPFILQYS